MIILCMNLVCFDQVWIIKGGFDIDLIDRFSALSEIQ